MKGRAWEMFSKYIRKRDGGLCITCRHPAFGRNYHAGHFIEMGVCGSDNKLGWDEDNVYGQCAQCNMYEGGRPKEFKRVLIERRGQKFVDGLRARIHKYDPISDWEEVYNYYKDKFEKLS